MPAVPAADETARRDEALSNACIDECMRQPEVRQLEGAAPLDHPSAAQAEQWWPNPGEDPVASFGGVSVSYSGVPAVTAEVCRWLLLSARGWPLSYAEHHA